MRFLIAGTFTAIVSVFMVIASCSMPKNAQEIKQAEKKHLITINVDGEDLQVHSGKWIVSDLKTKLGIDAAKVLAEITPHGLKDLDDNAEIKPHEHDKFITHARSGGAA